MDPKRLCDTIAYELRRLHETDYTDCPNIILNNWKLSGFIDVGNGGVDDRHIDIFWGVWTLWFNLKTNKYFARFLDAYGRDKADEFVLKIVAAAEVLGDHAVGQERCYEMFGVISSWEREIGSRGYFHMEVSFYDKKQTRIARKLIICYNTYIAMRGGAKIWI